MLIPNNKQKTRFFQMAGAARYVYNWVIERQVKNHALGGKFINHNSLSKEFTVYKKRKGNEWLYTISSNLTRQAIIDACSAFISFFEKQNRFPRYKSKKYSKISFANKYNKIKITDTHVKLEKISLSTKQNKKQLNYVRLAEKGRIPIGKEIVYHNPRVTFDGINWWLTVGVEMQVNYHPKKAKGIGIDLGIKNFAILSDGTVYPNINKTDRIKKLERRKRRLERQVSRKYEMNKTGGKYVKTKNILKLEDQILIINHDLRNIRKQYLHFISSSIVKREPSYIVLEDLNVIGMMKNKFLAKSIQEQNLNEFRRILEYKCLWNGIKVIIANRFFPSSKMCSKCGEINKDLSLKDRIFKCPCGHIMDRDEQASINLEQYGARILGLSD